MQPASRSAAGNGTISALTGEYYTVVFACDNRPMANLDRLLPLTCHALGHSKVGSRMELTLCYAADETNQQ